MARSSTRQWMALGVAAIVVVLLVLVASAPGGRPGRGLLLGIGDPVADATGGVDITTSPEGQQRIREAVVQLESLGHPRESSRLGATLYAGGDIIVGPKELAATDLRSTGEGYRARVTPGPSEILLAGPLTSASPYWSFVGDNCWILWRSTSHYDVCYRMYKMVNDGVTGKEYWRVDWYGTMFTGTGRTLDWGDLHIDQDAGPVQSFVDWDPTGDASGACQSETLNVTVLGVGGSWTHQHCELWDISKSGTTTLGYFKNKWSWGGLTPQRDRDRGVALVIATKGNNGWPTYGLSWNFAEH
jgi:hypothetical protein